MEPDPPRSLPPPLPGTAVLLTARPPSTTLRAPTLPVVAAVGAMLVLTASLLVSKYLLDVVVDFEWPIARVCRAARRRSATDHRCGGAGTPAGDGAPGGLGHDIGLRPQWSDLGWGPVVWLGALGAQVVAAAVVVGLDLPISSNTEAINEASIDRTYVVSLVITAVIAAPIVEEMVFRGVVLRGLRSRMPAVVAIVVQGLLFGAAHVDPVRGAGNVGLVMVLSGVGIAFGRRESPVAPDRPVDRGPRALQRRGARRRADRRRRPPAGRELSAREGSALSINARRRSGRRWRFGTDRQRDPSR